MSITQFKYRTLEQDGSVSSKGYKPIEDTGNGNAGLSAYEIWLKNGHEGTEQDFLKSLVGKPFTYSDFTPEQIQALKGKDFKFTDFTAEQLAALKGLPGKDFKYSDFTPQQLAALKGDPGKSITIKGSAFDANGNTVITFSDDSSVIVQKGKDSTGGGGTPGTIDARNVIPDADHQFVTAAEKVKWNSSIGGNVSSYIGPVVVSVTNFEAVADADPFTMKGTDNYKAFQDAIDWCIANNVRHLFIPRGRYYLSKGFTIQANGFATLHIFGESTRFDNFQTVLNIGAKDDFGIGLQCNKGTIIEGIYFFGPWLDYSRSHGLQNEEWKSSYKTKLYNSLYEDWNGDTRDASFSPHACIVIDYKTNTGNKPADGGYPQRQNEYVANTWGGGKTTGSSGVIVRNCAFNGFGVSVCVSPNGETQNAEELVIEYNEFLSGRTCLSGGQAQEKNNACRNNTIWGTYYEFYTNQRYGVKGYGNWNFRDNNVASSMVQYVYANTTGWFDLHFSDSYGEEIGRFGMLKGENNTCTNLQFDLAYIEYGAGQRLLFDCQNNAQGVTTFTNCKFRYFGKDDRDAIIVSSGLYLGCTFSYFTLDVASAESGAAIFDRCRWGRKKMTGRDAGSQGIAFSKGNEKVDLQFSLDANNNLTATFITQYPQLYQQDGTVAFVTQDLDLSTWKGFAICTNIDGNNITITYPTGVVDGQYIINPIYPIEDVSFVADIIGPHELSKIDYPDPAKLVGLVIKAPESYKGGVGSGNYVKIVSYDPATKKAAIGSWAGWDGFVENKAAVKFTNQ